MNSFRIARSMLQVKSLAVPPIYTKQKEKTMEPIISPWVIYLMSIADTFRMGLAIASLLSVVVIILALLYLFTESGCLSDEVQKILTRIIKASILFLSVSATTMTLLPGSDTIARMIIAKNVTPNNIALVSNIALSLKDSAKDDFIEIIREIKNDEAENKDASGNDEK